MYYPCLPWNTQLALFPGFALNITLVSGGNKEGLLKSKLSKRYAHVDNLGFILEFLRRLIVGSA